MSDAVIEAMARALSAAADGATFWERVLSEADRAELIAAMRAALAAAEAMGWRLVPVEATSEMVAAYGFQIPTRTTDAQAAVDWSAMLAAAPRVGGSDAGD